MADKGYIGPQTDTPDERRITPIKKPSLPTDITHNTAVNKERVQIECFFGRVCMKWAIAGEVYRWDHTHFDLDFENVCLLTNNIIKVNQLTEVDYRFYLNLCNMRYGEQLTKQEKRKLQIQRAKEKRLAKLARTDPYVHPDI